MKVLMTTCTDNGIWNDTLALCKTLNKNTEIHLAALGWPDKNQQKEIQQFPNIILYKSGHALGCNSLINATVIQKAKNWINSIYHTIHPNIIHLHTPIPLGNYRPEPVIYSYHSCNENITVQPNTISLKHKWCENLQQNTFNVTDVVLTENSTTIESLKQKFSGVHDMFMVLKKNAKNIMGAEGLNYNLLYENLAYQKQIKKSA
ncbi:glycosyltransferase family 4 protein [Zhouia sp. PK063]|uniref:glycosyltransferase family 4 protein n=1 Tax=Zhouia sp. PK063 TaxID=3373602 RepID=UPI0037988246